MPAPTTPAEIFRQMPGHYVLDARRPQMTYYFSIDDTKATVFVGPEGCRVVEGKAVDNADCVLKTTGKIFVDVVVHGKTPGALDIARGRFKTSSPEALLRLRDMFRF